MQGEMEDKCGIVGIHSKDISRNVSSFVYYCLYALQHRGQESAGIATFNQDKGLNYYCGMGLITDVFKDYEINNLDGNIAIGHVRYSTTGQSKLENSQPFVTDFDDGFIAMAHNGDIVNSGELREELIKDGYEFKSDTDSEVICYLLKKEHHDNNKSILDAIESVSRQLVGSYALVILVNGDLYGVRGPMGIKPLAVAKKGDDFVLASETVAFDVINAEFIRDIVPGEVVYFENDEIKSHMLEIADETDLSHCMFEYVYFARPDSTIDGINVYQTRLNIGKELYKLYPIDADVVIPVPDSSIPAAIGYSRASGIPYGEGLIKNRYVGRTFIMPTQEERELAVRLKLNPIKEAIKGKKIILIDDSIVRGTTSKKLLDLVKEAEPAEIHFLVGCPPVIAPCFYGVAMATKKELIAANFSIEEIKKQLNIDTLGYITLDSLIDAIGMPAEDLCLGCLNEEYPTELPDDIEAETYYKP
ncbi:MAG: amidophosphoribosyltransferase [Methanobrevibacter sp.]|uniref:Amidophosphoribosyltransferase n=1 Tax=Methanobrevibacter millerae TaxID=230361 RepID=A0A8T3VHI3_9EURY|nr:amidophosphoribosyltransferase [Methanobrevibacter millerae]MBE6504140.1 amidophosphoribosyltransferase [Methanobrevibacter millerae]MBR0058273.1 amidophosphoribosyltransferase [Methanobrevibacter sp.]MBR0370286.1 amidophosphoribosyltransferase [Methanobrevibacter sp.]